MVSLFRLVSGCLMLAMAAQAHAQAAAAAPQPAGRPRAVPAPQSVSPRTRGAAAAPTSEPIKPAPAPDAAAVPLIALDKKVALEQLRPKTAEVQINLQQVRVVRTRDFTGADSPANTVGVTTMNSSGAVQDLFNPGISFIVRVSTPEYCGILDFKNTHIAAISDQSGKPIRPAAATAAQAPRGGAKTSISDSNIISWSQNEALLQLTAGLPPRGDSHLKKLVIQSTVDVGLVTPIQVGDLRQKTGQLILDHPEGVDLSIKVESIDTEKIVLVAEGAVKRLGQYEFAAANGEAVQPYANTIDVQAVQPDGHPRQTATYSFFNLPQVLTLKIKYYPKIETKLLQLSFDEVPLP